MVKNSAAPLALRIIAFDTALDSHSNISMQVNMTILPLSDARTIHFTSNS